MDGVQQPPMDATRIDLYHHYPQMNPEKDKYMVSKAKMKGDISKLQTERAVLASSVTRMQLEVEDIQHHLAVSKNQLARLSKLDALEKERDALLLENTLLRRQQVWPRWHSLPAGSPFEQKYEQYGVSADVPSDSCTASRVVGESVRL